MKCNNHSNAEISHKIDELADEIGIVDPRRAAAWGFLLSFFVSMGLILLSVWLGFLGLSLHDHWAQIPLLVTSPAALAFGLFMTLITHSFFNDYQNLQETADSARSKE